jgi:hypothetical protein
MAMVAPSPAISPFVACQIRHVIDLLPFSGNPSRVVIDLAPGCLPSPLKLAKHDDCPSKSDATTASFRGSLRLTNARSHECGLTGESHLVSAFFGHRSDPGLPKYTLKGDPEKKRHATNMDWEIA